MPGHPRGVDPFYGYIWLTTPGGTKYWYNPADGTYGLPDSASARYPLSYIYGLAAHTPTAATTQQTATGVEVQAAALGGKIAVIYGQDRVAGDIFFGPWSGGFSGSPGQITTGFGLGEGVIDSLVKVETSPTGTARSLVNGSPGSSFTGFGGLGDFAFYAGVDAPAAADTYFTNVSTAYGNAFTERYPGLAYVSAFLQFDGINITSFPSFLFTVRGRKLLDPRLGVDGNGIPNQPAAWSDNAMLVLVDYFTSSYYGLGTPLSGINWVSVAAIANWCDQMFGIGVTNASNTSPIFVTVPAHGLPNGGTITIGGVLGNTAANGTWNNVVVIDANTLSLTGSVGNGAYTSGGIAGRKRFTINTTLRREASHQANIDFLRSHFRCTYSKTNGLITFYVDQPASSVKVFDEADHAITGCTNASPIVVTCPGHQRNTGDSVLVRNVAGNTAANGRFVATVIDTNTLSLNGSAGNGAYTSGGAITGNCRALKRWRTPSTQIPTKISYAWTDPSRDYQTATAVDITAAAQAGLVYTRNAPYNADGCRNSGQGQSQATYLLKKRGKDLNHSIMCNRAEGLAMEMYDVCTLNLPSFGLSNYEARIVRIAKFSTGEFQFDFEEYDSTIYPDVIAGTQTKPAVTLPDPTAVPPTPSAPVLTQEGLDVRVDFSPPSPAYPYYGGTLITVLVAGGTTYNLAPPISGGPLYIRGVTMGKLYTVKAYVVSVLNAALISLAATATVTPALTQPEWPTVTTSYRLIVLPGAVAPGRIPQLQIDPPQIRTRVQYAGAAWSVPGGITASKVNDGSTALSSGTLSTGNQLAVDLGSAKDIREVRIWADFRDGRMALQSLAYSDTAITGPWTSLTVVANSMPQNRYTSTFVGGSQPADQANDGSSSSWPSQGAHRFWQWTFSGDPTDHPPFYEFQMYEWTGVDQSVVGYNIYSLATGVEVLIATVPANSTTVVYDASQMVYGTGNSTSNAQYAVAARIRSVQTTLGGTPVVSSLYLDDFLSWSAAQGIATISTHFATESLWNKAFDSTTTVVTQAAGDNSTKPASTAFVIGQAAAATPIIDGTGAPGTSTRFARADHVHPTDTSRLAASAVQDIPHGGTGQTTAGSALDALTIQGADVASAATTNIGAGTGRNVNVTGTTTITAFDNVAAGIERVTTFTGILTLTYDATKMILPGLANIVTAAGDAATWLSLGSGNWRCTDYQRAAVAPLPGAWITPAFAAGTYGSNVGSWTVTIGEVSTFKYTVIGKTMILAFVINGGVTTGSPAYLTIVIPGGFSAVGGIRNSIHYSDDDAATAHTGIAVTSSTHIQIHKDLTGATAWGNAACYVQGEIAFEIA